MLYTVNVLTGSIYSRRKSQSINQAENSGDALCRVHMQYVPTYIQICSTEQHTINSVEMKLHIKNCVWSMGSSRWHVAEYSLVFGIDSRCSRFNILNYLHVHGVNHSESFVLSRQYLTAPPPWSYVCT